MSGRSCSKVAAPMPRTRVRSSTTLNGRAATIIFANAGPIPSNDSNSFSDAVLMSMRCVAASATGRLFAAADSDNTQIMVVQSINTAKNIQLHGTALSSQSQIVGRCCLDGLLCEAMAN